MVQEDHRQLCVTLGEAIPESSLRTGHGTARNIVDPEISVDEVVKAPVLAIPEVYSGAAGCSAVCGRPTHHPRGTELGSPQGPGVVPCCPDPEDARDLPRSPDLEARDTCGLQIFGNAF